HHPRELLRERLPVVLLLFRPDVAAGRQDEPVLGDLLRRRGLAEARYGAELPRSVLLLVPPLRGRLAAPLAEGVDDPPDVRVRRRVPTVIAAEHPQRPRLHGAELAGVDEERLAVASIGPVRRASLDVPARLVAGQEPEADRD